MLHEVLSQNIILNKIRNLMIPIISIWSYSASIDVDAGYVNLV